MQVKVYFSQSLNQYSIEFPYFDLLVGITPNGPEKLKANYEDAQEWLFGGDVTGAIDNVASTNNDFGLTTAQLLLVIADVLSE